MLAIIIMIFDWNDELNSNSFKSRLLINQNWWWWLKFELIIDIKEKKKLILKHLVWKCFQKVNNYFLIQTFAL